MTDYGVEEKNRSNDQKVAIVASFPINRKYIFFSESFPNLTNLVPWGHINYRPHLKNVKFSFRGYFSVSNPPPQKNDLKVHFQLICMSQRGSQQH